VRRISALVVVAAGIAVLFVGLTNDLFTIAPAFEDVTDGFRDDVMSDEALIAARTDLVGLQAVSDELPDLLAGLAEVFDVDAAGLDSLLEDEFPDLAAGIEVLPAATERVTAVTTASRDQQANFESADALPTSTTPATALPWLIVGAGALMVAVGLVMWWSRRVGSWLAVLVGLGIVAATTGASLIPKAGDADQLNEAFRPLYTAEFVIEVERDVGVLGAMGTELADGVVPRLAEQLDVPDVDAIDYLTETYPATGAALDTLPDAVARLRSTVEIFATHLDDYETMSSTELSPIAWTVLVAAIVTSLFGLVGLFGSRPKVANGDEPPTVPITDGDPAATVPGERDAPIADEATDHPETDTRER
jgi:hypothetical protein